jgi:hypothetical protein
MTNSAFDIQRLDVAEDEALVAIGDAGWGLYDDFGAYRLRGRRALGKQALEAVARCVVFLDSDLPYEWAPRRPTISSLLATLLTLGYWLREDRRRWQSTGPYHVWPFMRESDYQRSLASPRRLSGRANEKVA